MQDILATVPKRLLLAYIFDWIVIIVVAIIGYGFSKATPNSNPFSLTDGSISYPFKKHETVPSHVQVFISLVGPATIIALVVLVLIPGSAVSRNAPRSLKWRYRIWECNAGWMGLAVALAGAYTATHGLKNLVGKPRPDFLARCDPDLSNIAAYAVGGLGQQLDGAPTLVTWEICQNKSNKVWSGGFSSFPSGHSSFAFAGMTYLTSGYVPSFRSRSHTSLTTQSSPTWRMKNESSRSILGQQKIDHLLFETREPLRRYIPLSLHLCQFRLPPS